MIKHIVMWRLKEHAAGNDKATNLQLLKSQLEALKDKIDGVLELEVGLDFVHAEASADIVLYTAFADRSVLDAYQAHPEHQAVVKFVNEVRSERYVVDYEL